VGLPDVIGRDLNELNKRTDATTGWSDHGARWMAPETGRWLTTDPPVAEPDDKFMFAPWALHPYQYVHQNPVIYWDPDGRDTNGLMRDEARRERDAKLFKYLGQLQYDRLVQLFTRLGQQAEDAANGWDKDYTPEQREQKGWDFLAVGLMGEGMRGGGRSTKAAGAADDVVDAALAPEVECPGGVCTCFVAGTEITLAEQVKPIEQVRVGDRVLPSSDRCENTQLADWVEIELATAGPDGDWFTVKLLRPRTWVDVTGATIGGNVRIELDDLNVAGWAKVISLQSRAPVAKGAGCIVTGTIEHISHEVITVALDEGAPPLEVTERHRLYSATRDAWVAAGDLKAGEALSTRDGTILVREIAREGHAPTPVYNLEVADGHRYYAGPRAVLAHNAYTDGVGGPTSSPKMLGSKGTQMTSKTIWKGNKGMRIDVENPNPGQRAGQIHFQQGRAKFQYDPGSKTFTGAPNAVNDLLKTPEMQAAIAKGLRFLGE
jgi:RHS repeat-associated protein